MQFILVLLTAVVFFCCLFLAYWIGNKQAKSKIKNNYTEEEEKLRQKAIRQREDFMKLMNYDVNTALQRKKVT